MFLADVKNSESLAVGRVVRLCGHESLRAPLTLRAGQPHTQVGFWPATRSDGNITS